MKVIIVGGGLCGLYIAYLLKNINIDFEIHEKSSRPGGRIKSINAFGKNLECGAHLIKPHFINTISLLAKLNLQTSIIDDKNSSNFIDQTNLTIFNNLLQKIKLSYDRDQIINTSAIIYIKSILSDIEFNIFIDLLRNMDINLQNEIGDFMKYNFYDIKIQKQSQYLSINGGLQMLTDKLAQLVQEKLYLNSPVTAITYLPITNAYIVEANGRLINADHLVIATDASIKMMRLSIPKEIKISIQSVSARPAIQLYTLHSNKIKISNTQTQLSVANTNLTQIQSSIINIKKVDKYILKTLIIPNILPTYQLNQNNQIVGAVDLLYDLLIKKEQPIKKDSLTNNKEKNIIHKLLENIIAQSLPQISDFVVCKWTYGSHFTTNKIKTNFWAKYNLILAGEWVHPYHNTIEGSIMSAIDTFNIITKDLFKDKLKHQPDNVTSIEVNRTKYVDYPVKIY